MAAATKPKPKPKPAPKPTHKPAPVEVKVVEPEPPKVQHPPADDEKRWPCWYVNDEGETEMFNHPDDVNDGFYRR